MGHKSAGKMRANRSPSERAMLGKAKITGVTLHLSAEAKEKLQKLRFRSLDARGQMPDVSEVIERLIHGALKNESKMPYPKVG